MPFIKGEEGEEGLVVEGALRIRRRCFIEERLEGGITGGGSLELEATAVGGVGGKGPRGGGNGDAKRGEGGDGDPGIEYNVLPF